MSVIATYTRISAEGLDRLQSEPHWLELLDQEGIPGAVTMDIDKACDGITWLLTRCPPPPEPAASGPSFTLHQNLARMISGEACTKETRLEAPYGPACSLAPPQVRSLSKWLQTLEEAVIRAHYNPKVMAKESVYPQIWMDEGAAAFDEYLLPYFRQLRAFLKCASDASQFVLIYFT